MFASIAVEGFADELAATRLCQHLSIGISVIHNCKGKPALDRRLAGFNAAARFSDWLVLRDMDNDAGCPPSLKNGLLPRQASRMTFRLVVREIEAWLLGDQEQFASYFRIRRNLVPSAPENLRNPKREVLSIVSKSHSKDIRLDMLPRPGSGAREGPLYATRLAEFASQHWRPDVAAASCDSLARAIAELERKRAISEAQGN